MFGLTSHEERVFKKLSTPMRIQDYLDALPTNFEKHGETHYSPRRVLREKKAHCIEGALLAAALLWYHGEKPLLLDLKTRFLDDEHVVALFRKNGYWGALSKTNHAVLRYRDPIYKTVRELALSYFHEYFRDRDGVKTLISYSKPFDLRTLGEAWVTSETDLWDLDDILNDHPHYPLVPQKQLKLLRNATPYERRVINVREWEQVDPRT
jgi:hypothetical protein